MHGTAFRPDGLSPCCLPKPGAGAEPEGLEKTEALAWGRGRAQGSEEACISDRLRRLHIGVAPSGTRRGGKAWSSRSWPDPRGDRSTSSALPSGRYATMDGLRDRGTDGSAGRAEGGAPDQSVDEEALPTGVRSLYVSRRPTASADGAGLASGERVGRQLLANRAYTVLKNCRGWARDCACLCFLAVLAVQLWDLRSPGQSICMSWCLTVALLRRLP